MSRLQQGISNSTAWAATAQQHLPAVQPEHGRRQRRRKELRRTQAADPLEARRAARLHAVLRPLSQAAARDIRRVIEHLCDTENPLLNRIEREKLIEEVLDETLGFGPLKSCSRTRRSRTSSSTARTRSTSSAAASWRRPRSSSATTTTCCRSSTASCRRSRPRGRDQPDGGRPAPGRPCERGHPADRPRRASLSIRRRFGANLLKLEDLLNYKAFTPEMAMLMEACIKARLNVLIEVEVRLRQDDALEHALQLHPRR